MFARRVARVAALTGLMFALGGCAGNEFATMKSLPPPPVKPAYMPVSQQVTPPFGYIGFCVHHPQECEGGNDHPTRLALTPARWRTLERVNAEVNALPEIGDQENYGSGDVWSYPDANGGDCEDLALEKRRRLMAGGWPGEALLIATAASRTGEGHAVLIAAMAEGDLVLDNLDTVIRLWSDTPYRWRARQSARRPFIWLNADPARIALSPQPQYPPLGAALPFAVIAEKPPAATVSVSAF